MPLELLITDATTMQPGELKKIIQVLQVLAGESPVHVVTNMEVKIDPADIKRAASEVMGGIHDAGKPHDPGAELVKALLDPQNQQTIKSAAEAFAQSTADAGQSQTAPVDTAVTTSTGTESDQPTSAQTGPGQDAQTENAEAGNPAQDVDSEGVAWDKRIHSEGRTKIANGTWRMKKGVSQDTIDAVLGEQGLKSEPAASAPPPPPPAKTDEAAPPPPPPPKTTGEPRNWMQTVQRSVDGIKKGSWTNEAMGKFLMDTFGVPGVSKLVGDENIENLAILNAAFDQWELEASAE